MRVALSKTAGIASSEVSLKSAQADITLQPGNHVTVTQLRELMRKNGYPTKDAHITGKGRLSLRGNTVVLDWLNGTVMDVAVDPKAASEIEKAARDASHPIVEVTGVSRADGRTEILTLTGLR